MKVLAVWKKCRLKLNVWKWPKNTFYFFIFNLILTSYVDSKDQKQTIELMPGQSASPASPPPRLHCVQLQSDVCITVTLNRWSQRASCSTNTHCRACGVSNVATAFCVSACVCVCVSVCVWFTVQSESSCLCRPFLPLLSSPHPLSVNTQHPL